MTTPPESIGRFLAARRIAVAGVSRDPKQAANAILRKLRSTGAEVFPVNPRARSVEGVTCYPCLADIPGGVDAVLIATSPQASVEVARECVRLGITQVWIHRSFGRGSVSDEAVKICREHGIPVIVGGCPMMYAQPVDVAHRCMRWILTRTGKLEETPAARV